MSTRAHDILTSVYDVPKERVAIIPHGVPDMPFLDPSYNKDRFDLVGKKVLLTFGLLSDGKGLEYVIEALPAIVARHPETVFAILGATHPDVRRRDGEAYRHMLQRRAEELGVSDHVVFYNQFIATETLIEFLSAADVCITPYLGREQIVSGVLSYALGAGKAIVSTPYCYAEEMLADGRGRLVPFRDSAAIAHEVIDLLDDDVARNALRKRAYLAARPMIWKDVAGQYLAIFRDARRERGVRPRTYRSTSVAALQSPTFELPYPKLDHLRVMTDDTGILQHARFDIPDRDHGYCTDDNARALVVVLLAQHVLPDTADLGKLAHRYVGFLQQAFNRENGRFRNFMSYDRRWQEDTGSEDSHGRAIWALGQTVFDSPSQGMAAAANELFELALPRAMELTAPRACAGALLGVEAYLRRFGGATEVRRAYSHLADRLFEGFQAHATADWPWFEDTLTYANGLVPHALVLAGTRLANRAMLETALGSLSWLTDLQTDPRGHFVPIGNRGWYARNGSKARFDQQPIEVQHMALAHLEAYKATGERRWLEEARRAFEWFLGRNDLRLPVCDHATGGCRDGLQPERLNQNEGAESTLAWLHSVIAFHIATGTAAMTVRDLAEARRMVAPPQAVAAAAGVFPELIPGPPRHEKETA